MKPDGTIWAFDLGKASIGEAVRQGNKFLHKASLLIPAEFAETKTAAGRRRMWRTRQAHTGRIRRKYKLNSLLNPDAKSEEEAETKNRSDDRHHALDAMVISFIPNWARNSRVTGFFCFPDGVHRELFGKEIAEVVPKNVCFEKPTLAETIYGIRDDYGKQVIVQRAKLISLAMRSTTPGKSVFDLKYALKQAQFVRDPLIRERLLEFLGTSPDEASWRKFCTEFHLKRKNGSNGPRVECVGVNVGESTEYKDMSKDGTGAYRKALKGHKGQIVYLDSNRKPRVQPVYAFTSLADAKASLSTHLGKTGRFIGFFQSGCTIAVTKDVKHATKPLPAGKYLLNTIITSSGQIKITTPAGKTYPDIPKYNLAAMIEAGLMRVD